MSYRAHDGIGQVLPTAVKDDLMVIMGTVLFTVILISLASLPIPVGLAARSCVHAAARRSSG
jgi:hypothetical protein